MATTVRLTLSPEELNLVLVALGKLPYVQVHELIGRIQTEAGPQLLAAMRDGERTRPREPEP
jgi:hypothetical protein